MCRCYCSASLELNTLSTPNSSAIFKYPSVQRFIEQVTSDITLNQRHVAVYIHRLIDLQTLWVEIDQCLELQGYRTEVIDISKIVTASPITGIIKALSIARNGTQPPQAIENLAGTEFPCDVLGLIGWEYLDESQFRKWYDFVDKWVRFGVGVTQYSNSSMDATQPPRLCLLISPGKCSHIAFQTSLSLVVRWWWGIFYGTESQWVRQELNFGDATSVRERWLQHLLPSIASGDPALGEFLSQKQVDLSFSSYKSLVEYATTIGWDEQLPDKSLVEICQRISTFSMPIPAPPPILKPLWDEGMVYVSQMYGVELHSALVALLGDTRELQRRVWRGQVGLVLPVVDEIRRRVCQHMTIHYGNSWPTRWCTPSADSDIRRVEQDALSCDIGYLLYLLNEVNQLASERHEYLRLLRIAVEVRNELAHYRGVTFPQFEDMVNALMKSPLAFGLPLNDPLPL